MNHDQNKPGASADSASWTPPAPAPFPGGGPPASQGWEADYSEGANHLLSISDVGPLIDSFLALLPSLQAEDLKALSEAIQGEILARSPGLPALPEEDEEDVARTPSADLSDASLIGEVERLIDSIRGMHETLMPGGKARLDVTARDATSFINASTSAIANLLKYRERIYNLSRQGALERAVITVLRSEDKELADRVMAAMENELRKIN